MTTFELLSDLQRQGFNLIPLPEGKLAVKPAERLTDALWEQIRQCKSEVLVLLTKPYINPKGELIIPFTSDPRYHWWAGGQSITATLWELQASLEVWKQYTKVPYGPVQ